MRSLLCLKVAAIPHCHRPPVPPCSIPDPLFRGVKISGFWLVPHTNRWANAGSGSAGQTSTAASLRMACTQRPGPAQLAAC